MCIKVITSSFNLCHRHDCHCSTRAPSLIVKALCRLPLQRPCHSSLESDILSIQIWVCCCHPSHMTSDIDGVGVRSSLNSFNRLNGVNCVKDSATTDFFFQRACCHLNFVYAFCPKSPHYESLIIRSGNKDNGTGLYKYQCMHVRV